MWPDLSTTLHSCAPILSGPKQCQSNALHLLEPRVKWFSVFLRFVACVYFMLCNQYLYKFLLQVFLGSCLEMLIFN